MVTSTKKGSAILLLIASAISIISAAACKFLRAYGKYKIDCAKAYSIKKSANRRR